MCAFPGQQCCSEDFISYVSNTVRNTLTLYLRKEYNTTINNFLDEAEDLFDCKYTQLHLFRGFL